MPCYIQGDTILWDRSVVTYITKQDGKKYFI